MEYWDGNVLPITQSLEYSVTPIHFFFALGPNGSGWNGPSRICR
jgi:hypothetical protein